MRAICFEVKLVKGVDLNICELLIEIGEQICATLTFMRKRDTASENYRRF